MSKIADNKYENTKHSEKTEQVLCFSVDTEVFGIELEKVNEVIRLTNLTHLPKAPKFVKGIINLRGNVIPIIDLREKFGLQSLKYSSTTRAIIMEINDNRLGIIVDEVSKVNRINSSSIQESKSFSSFNADYIKGIANDKEQLIIILDMNKILTNNEISMIKNDEIEKYNN